MRCTVLIALVLVLATAQAAKKLPDYVQVCRRSDPEYDACVLRSIESLRGRLGRGIPQLQVPGYEPLIIPGLHIDRNTEALEINANLENIKVGGASKFVINSLKTSLADHGLQASITLPELQISTDFDVTGRLLVVPLNGKGSMDGTLKNVKADLRAEGKVVERKNKKYLQIVSLRSDIRLGDAKLNFQGPKSAKGVSNTLNNAATSFIEENRQQVFQIAKPIIEDTVNELFTEIINRVFQSVPYDVLLPE